MPRVKAPDGNVIKFPDSMSNDEISMAMQRLYPPAADRPSTGFASKKRGFQGRGSAEQAAKKAAAQSVAFRQKSDRGYVDKATIGNAMLGGLYGDVEAGIASVPTRVGNVVKKLQGQDPKFTGNQYQRQYKKQVDELRRKEYERAPIKGTIQNVAGVGAAAGLIPFGGAAKTMQGAKGLSAVTAAAKPVLAGGAVGAAYGAGEGDTLRERGQNALTGGATALALGAGLSGLAAGAPVAARMLKKRPLSAEAIKRQKQIRMLQESGVELTPGQMLGGTAQQLEDLATRFSGGIRNARQRSMDQFGTATINKVLKPIGASVNPKTLTGTDQIAEMIDIVGKNYGNTFKQAVFTPDQTFIQNAKDLTRRELFGADSESIRRAKAIADRFIGSRAVRQGSISGNDLTQTLSQIRNTIRSERTGSPLANYLSGLEREVIKSAVRNGSLDPKAAARATKAYAESIRVEQAANLQGAGAGNITPASLNSAVKRFAGGARKRDFAAGRALMQDYSTAARDIMGNKAQSSGTAENVANIATYTSAATGLATGNALALAPLAIKAVARGVYSPPVISLLNRIAKAKTQQQANSGLLALQSAARTNPQAAKALRQLLSVQGSRASVIPTGQMTQAAAQEEE